MFDVPICIFKNTGIITDTQILTLTVTSYNNDIVSFCKCGCPGLIKKLILKKHLLSKIDTEKNVNFGWKKIHLGILHLSRRSR